VSIPRIGTVLASELLHEELLTSSDSLYHSKVGTIYIRTWTGDK
jgi:hypothetical protein